MIGPTQEHNANKTPNPLIVYIAAGLITICLAIALGFAGTAPTNAYASPDPVLTKAPPPEPTYTSTSTRTPTPFGTPTPRPTGCAVQTIFREDFESGSLGLFTSTVFPSSAPGWSPITDQTHTGIYSAFAPDIPSYSYQKLTVSQPIPIPTNIAQATLTFWHRYSFEPPNLDCGWLMLSTNGGFTWTGANPYFISGGYNVDCMPDGVPVHGWGLDTGEQFLPVRLDLTSFAGRNITFKFEERTSSFIGGIGWWVDDIELTVQTACQSATPTPTRTLVPDPTPTLTPSPTPTGCAVQTIFHEDFESGTLGLFTSTAWPTNAPGWSPVTDETHSGSYSAFEPDNPVQSTQSLITTQPVPIPTNIAQATLTFWHRYSFEPPRYDCGWLLLSTNGGSTWTWADPYFITGGYNVRCWNDAFPIDGWGLSTGEQFLQVQVDLTSFAGQNLIFKFEERTDTSIGDIGWWVDDIELTVRYSCQSGTPTRTPTFTRTPMPTSTPTHTVTGTPPTSTRTRTPTRTLTPANTPTARPTGCALQTILQEDFESGTLGALTSSVEPITAPGWNPVIDYTYTGAYSAFAPDIPYYSKQRLTLSQPVPIPTNIAQATLSFWHRYSFELPNYDCGWLYLSTNNGSTWTNAYPYFISGGYNIGCDDDGFLQYGWGANTQGQFLPVQVDLTSFAGQNLIFRYEERTDGSIGAEGWWVDDIQLSVQFTCTTGTPTPTSPPSTLTPTLIPPSTSTNTATLPSSTLTPANTPTATSPPSITPSLTSTGTPQTTPTSPITATSTPTTCPIQFADVPPDHTFYPFIRCLACHAILTGYPCGSPTEPCNPSNDPYFRPSNPISRGQIAKIVSNSASFIDPPSGQSFQDIPPDHTFYTYTQRLATRGIMSGYPCGGTGEPCIAPTNMPYFRPQSNTTRAQVTKIVAKAIGYEDPPISQSFEDIPPNSTFYLWIENLASREIMSGYPCGSPTEPCVPPTNLPYFRPSNSATRGQVSKIVSNTFFPTCPSP